MSLIKNNFSIFGLSFFLIFLITGCLKDPNPGPRGPRGDKGEPGTEVGPEGPQGDKGADAGGIPGVIASEWKDVVEDVDYGTGYHRYKLDAPEITTKLQDEAIVLVYFKDPSTDKVYKVEFFNSPDFEDKQMSQLVATGAIRIYTNMDATQLKFRYVIVPNQVPLEIQNDLRTLDVEDFSKVRTYFHLD